MEKLTIKEIAPYLPYGLQLKHDFKKVRYNGRNSPLEDWVMELEPSMLNCFILKDKRPFQRKPILRPLSDLTKEIMHNGETFVPLIEIAKSYEIIVNDDDGFLENGKIVWYEILEDPNDRDQPIDNECRFYFDVSKSIKGDHLIFQKIWEDSVMLVLNNQIQPFDYQEMQKLFEWHFDVFDLLSSGMAVNINTLSK